MRKILSIMLALLMLAVPAVSVTASAADEASVIYYAKIQSLDAVYDRNTEKISFCINFSGAVFDTHSFTVVVYSVPRTNGVWGEKSMFGFHTLYYSDCLTSDTTLEGEVKVGKEAFLSEDYKDWEIYVTGKKLNTSIVGVEYYSMDSATSPVSLKGTPEGDFYKLYGGVTPVSTPVGGYVELKLVMKDIVDELSGGLTKFAFELSFDDSLMRAEGVDFSFPYNGGWSMTEQSGPTDGTLGFAFAGTDGVTDDGGFVLTVRFKTVAAGSGGFTVSSLSGGDAYGNDFDNSASYSVGGAVTVTSDGEEPPVSTGILGDVNNDGEVDSLDAAKILKYDAGIVTEIENGDVNGDGEVDSLDAAKILKYDAGIISSL